MAGNALVDIFRIKDLRQRLIFTFAVLMVFRIGATIPIPGINVNALKLYYLTAQSSSNGAIGLADYIDFFAGGGFKNFSVFMLGIMPYISMSIIMQLLILVFPKLKKISQEDGGRKKIARYTRYGTVVVCLIQSYAATVYARQIPDAITMSKLSYSLIAIVTVTTGSMLLVWMGEQITQRGVGNGVSLIIFAGIVARMPEAFILMFGRIKSKDINPVFLIIVLALFVVVIALVIYEQQGQRKIPVHYAKRVVGRKMYGGQNTYIPFKINPSGVIPVIFASSVMTFPLQILGGMGVKVRWMVLQAKAIKAIEDPEEKKAFIAEKEAEYKDLFASPYQAANRGYIDDVIEPRYTRSRIIRAFEMLQTKRLTNPLKKHSNIPL